MPVFRHRFDQTVLREYDIRGIVEKTLKPEDAFAIGRCFGSVVVRADGKRVAVGYDGRLHSPEMEAQLVAGLRACGLEVLRIGCGPTPMLQATARVARRFGVPCQVSLEEFMACAVGGCAGCAVPVVTDAGLAMKRVCVDGPVFDAEAVFPAGHA
jgi:hypothetical protein